MGNSQVTCPHCGQKITCVENEYFCPTCMQILPQEDILITDLSTAIAYCREAVPDAMQSSRSAQEELLKVLRNDAKTVRTFCGIYASAEKEMSAFFALTPGLKTVQAKAACSALCKTSFDTKQIDWFMTACCVGINQSADQLLGGKKHPLITQSGSSSGSSSNGRPGGNYGGSSGSSYGGSSGSSYGGSSGGSNSGSSGSSYGGDSGGNYGRSYGGNSGSSPGGSSGSSFGSKLKYLIVPGVIVASFILPPIVSWLSFIDIGAFWGGVILILGVLALITFDFLDNRDRFGGFIPTVAAVLILVFSLAVLYYSKEQNIGSDYALAKLSGIIIVINTFLRFPSLTGGLVVTAGIMLVSCILPPGLLQMFCTNLDSITIGVFFLFLVANIIIRKVFDC